MQSFEVHFLYNYLMDYYENEEIVLKQRNLIEQTLSNDQTIVRYDFLRFTVNDKKWMLYCFTFFKSHVLYFCWWHHFQQDSFKTLDSTLEINWRYLENFENFIVYCFFFFDFLVWWCHTFKEYKLFLCYWGPTFPVFFLWIITQLS